MHFYTSVWISCLTLSPKKVASSNATTSSTLSQVKRLNYKFKLFFFCLINFWAARGLSSLQNLFCLPFCSQLQAVNTNFGISILSWLGINVINESVEKKGCLKGFAQWVKIILLHFLAHCSTFMNYAQVFLFHNNFFDCTRRIFFFVFMIDNSLRSLQII